MPSPSPRWKDPRELCSGMDRGSRFPVPSLPDRQAGSPALREIQERFLAGLREGSSALAGTGLIAPPPAGSPGDRWHLYTEGYLLRLIEAIENDAPAVKRVLGERAFGSLCSRYLRACPPSSPDIGRAADRLATFLDTDPLAEKLPFLGDLARFELALARAVVAADPRPRSWQELATLGIERLLDLRIEPHPGTAVIRSAWPVSKIRALKDVPDNEVDLEVTGRPSTVVVFRDGLKVRWREIGDDEARFLECLLERPATLAELAESGRFGTPQKAAPLLVSLFRSAIESSIAGAALDVALTRESHTEMTR